MACSGRAEFVAILYPASLRITTVRVSTVQAPSIHNSIGRRHISPEPSYSDWLFWSRCSSPVRCCMCSGAVPHSRNWHLTIFYGFCPDWCSSICSVPGFILLPHIVGTVGLWLAIPVSELLTLTVITTFYVIARRRKLSGRAGGSTVSAG